jgi:hypothetical protein
MPAVAKLTGEGANTTAAFEDGPTYRSLAAPCQQDAPFVGTENLVHMVEIREATLQVLEFP